MQHKILEHEMLLKSLLYLKPGCFFIAGNAKQMPDQVRKKYYIIYICLITFYFL